MYSTLKTQRNRCIFNQILSDHELCLKQGQFHDVRHHEWLQPIAVQSLV